jgi:hypothetical protein
MAGKVPRDLDKLVALLRVARPPAGRSLTEYTNVVVIDPNGMGDYTSLTAAAAAALPDSSIYYVFGETTETAQLVIAGRVISVHLMPTAVLNFGAYNILVEAGGYLNIYGSGVITSTNTTATIDFDTDGVLSTKHLEIVGPLEITNTGGGRTIYTRYGTIFDIRFCTLSNGSVQLDVTDDGDDKFVFAVVFKSGVYSIGAISHWPDAPVYFCVGELANYKVAFTAANRTNVFGGVSNVSPWRGSSASDFTTTTLPYSGDYGYQSTDTELQINIGGTIRAIATSAL